MLVPVQASTGSEACRKFLGRQCISPGQPCMLCRFGEGSAAQGFRCAVQLPTCWTAACTDTANMRDVAGRLFARAVQAGASRARTQSSPIAVQGSTCGRVKLGRHVQKTQVHSRSSARGQSAKVLDHGLDKIVYTLSSLKRIFGAMICFFNAVDLAEVRPRAVSSGIGRGRSSARSTVPSLSGSCSRLASFARKTGC